MKKILLLSLSVGIFTLVGCGDNTSKDTEESADKTSNSLIFSSEKKEVTSLPKDTESESSKPIEESKEEVKKEARQDPKKESVSREFSSAKSHAESYLDYTAFSKEGLYDQLIFEGYPEDAARYAVDNVVVNWKDQALAKAQDYLDYSSFSDSGLYDQLIHEKFTPEQAQYAIDNL